MRSALIFAALAARVDAIPPTIAAYVLDLGSAHQPWQVSNANASLHINATVPGQVHLDLLAAGVIDEPTYGMNDGPTGALGWIATDNWTYTCTWSLSATVLQYAQQEIVFEGLDTVAVVTLNGRVILSTDSMFRRYNVDVKGALRTGSNTLTVAFTSAVTWAAQQEAIYPNITTHPIPHVNYQNGYPSINFIRKEPASFAWDWGPAFATQGIWRNITLLAYNLASIRYAAVSTTPVDMAAGVWTLTSNLTIAGVRAQTGTLFVTVDGAAGKASFPVTLNGGMEQTVSVSLNVSGVEAWWPNGYGEPNLYTVTYTYIGLQSESTVLVQRVGFRTIQLVQSPLPAGTSFKFNVNGVDILIKGANWVPADPFEGRVTTTMISDLFDSYQDANFNTLRVWGGGVYQQEPFYDLADERGILIWQEFMFACALYPVHDAFLSTIAAEIAYQAARLQHHPSIMIWGANNENGISIADNWYSLPSNGLSQYVSEYSQLVFGTVLANFSDDSRPAVSTSPSDGDNGVANPIPSSSPGIKSGDTHFYTMADPLDPFNFPRPRFVSEYGWNSYASWITMQPFVSASQTGLSDPIWAWRDHSGGAAAIQRIRDQVALHYPSPASDTYIRDWLWMSQIVHAMAMKSETEHYRRIRDECDDATPGCTMGMLYWQANAEWAGADWSSIEYGGRWKVWHYYAKKAFAPYVVSMWSYGGSGGLYFVNDDPNSPANGTVAVTAYSYSQGQLGTWNVPFSIGPASATSLVNFTDAQLLANTNCPSMADCIWLLKATTPAYVPLADNFFFANNFTAATQLKDPKWQLKGVYNGPSQGTFTVAYTGAAIAPFVWFETPVQGHFDDNGFTFVDINGYSTVNFITKNATITASQLASTIQIWSLYDIWAGRPLPPVPALPM